MSQYRISRRMLCATRDALPGEFVKLRPKLFLLISAIAFAGLLLLCLLNYWQDTRQSESALRDSLRRDADWIAIRLNTELNEREAGLSALAQNSLLGSYLRCHPPVPANNDLLRPTLTLQKPAPECARQHSESVPLDLANVLGQFLMANSMYYGPLSVLNSSGAVVLSSQPDRVAKHPNQDGVPTVTFRTEALPGNARNGTQSIGADAGFVNARNNSPLRTFRESGAGTSIQYTIPVLRASDDRLRESSPVLGAVVIDLKLDQLFKEQVSDVVGTLNGVPTGTQTDRAVVVLQKSGRVYYHSSAPVSYQPVATSLPDFMPVATPMMAEETGARFFQASDGHRWLAAHRPLGQLDLSLAVTTDYSRAIAPANQELLRNFLFSLPIALLVAVPLTLIAQRRSGRSLERLTQGAVAIAGGRLDQQLVVSSAENQLLADSVNKVTARLREQLAREAESRQFDSFLRLSAMLTHDLKNAISGLSLMVGNMDRQFDKPEFRADAMESLRDATGKLQKLVTKLSDPINTMSGEHQRPRPTDLVPLLRRVLDSLTSAQSQFHTIQVELPPELIAETEAERMEKVIENLVINALEAMGSKSGVLTIAGGDAGAGKVFFTVTDTGPGMSKEFQERRLFHPFATTKHGGVGLGLYTCREVVRAFGGSISATSAPGVGTTFRVVLPSVQPGGQQH
jgi:signal transduction histidine kinase